MKKMEEAMAKSWLKLPDYMEESKVQTEEINKSYPNTLNNELTVLFNQNIYNRVYRHR